MQLFEYFLMYTFERPNDFLLIDVLFLVLRIRKYCCKWWFYSKEFNNYSNVCCYDLSPYTIHWNINRTTRTSESIHEIDHNYSFYHDTKVSSSPKWHARRAAIEFVQNMIFCNLFNARPYAQRLRQLVFKCLFDEQFEVRTVASVTLSGFYQCGYIQVNNDDLVNKYTLFFFSFYWFFFLLSFIETFSCYK